MTTNLTNPRLERLIAKATAAPWSMNTIAWATEPVLPAALPERIYVDMVSQLYHSELAALELLDRLVVELPEDQARRFLATQIADEHRHAAVYRRYLERLGELAPIDPGLAAIFAFARQAQLPAFAGVVALNIVMEHEALEQQQKRIDSLPCPLFGAINRAIVADESRHAGFGVVYLADALPRASQDDRLAVAAWVRELWAMWCKANEGRYAAAGAEVLRLERAHLGERWKILARRLATLGLATESELA
ncbi:MAG: ferritin-like domain-containing protein [Kofleriaceae bacterium]